MATEFSATAIRDAATATQDAAATSSATRQYDETIGTSVTDTEHGAESGSPAETLGKGDDDEVDDIAEMRRRSSVVQTLAKTYSRVSGAPAGNPFNADNDSPLNPNSPNFDGKQWAKAVVALVHQDGADFRSTGVCFQHLNVHGFGEATDYQKDVANIWMGLAGMVKKTKQRIDILRDFDGLVRNGEMLIVLGPPGSGCSTFLKTIAGEMNGIYSDDNSYFNYQGKSISHRLVCECLGRTGSQNLSHYGFSGGIKVHEMARSAQPCGGNTFRWRKPKNMLTTFN